MDEFGDSLDDMITAALKPQASSKPALSVEQALAAYVSKPATPAPSPTAATIGGISKYFTLADLTKTSYKVDNTPDAASLANLKKLAILMDRVVDEEGPIDIISGFRSAAVQAALQEKDIMQDTHYAATKKSYHEVGMAIDFKPRTGTVESLWARLVTKPWVQQEFTEFAIKPELGQKTIHASLRDPSKGFLPMIADAKTGYTRLSMDQVQKLVKDYLGGMSAINYGLIIGGLLGAVALIYWLVSKKRRQSSNPQDARPPKKWWDKMYSRIMFQSPDYSPEQIRRTIGQIWYNQLTQSKREEIRRRA